ncbi:LptA/OstA family protein [Silvibacterium dinghuense]|uniref:Organic solvent tolerance-like N-terminal domain-containing protein n=1 Tax=Silvibacterium dinghuense TaxID=1560006 RepID=A0A4Q1SE74_9BACT|nr:LptA/OstA family protein [Silvibacterium dinghuense]RXS95395.1 hypothetical protein ESZ00_12505 [Silvibacterium dinghuense]GGH12902.1 hypothetical protein GCM10011586_32450 [Silvibacterium dinghuense]
MRVTVARLRQGIVVLACLLFVILAGFFFYARNRFRHIEKDLPGRLGVNIEQTADGFTYSQSSQGHTLYTIHASKLFQYKSGGHATLHNVEITLYGAPGSNRQDHIYGSEFDYDKEAGIVTAKGDVQIDLSSLNGDNGANNNPAAKPAQTPPASSPQADDETAAARQGDVHIKTSGLTFNQKTGDAVTSEHTEFTFPRAAGSSTGANYNSKTGLLVLDKDVVLTTSSDGNQAVVHATHATLLRSSMQAFLLNPVTDYQSEKSSADQATVYFRKDGSTSQIHAQGHVHMTTDSGAVLTAENTLTQMDAKSQPTQTDAGGGVNFVSNGDNSSMHGTAVRCSLTYGPKEMLKHARCNDAVNFVEQILSLADDPKGTASRQVQASQLDVDFVPGPDGKKAVAQKALGTGSAEVNLHTIPSTGGQELTNIKGDQLLAIMDDSGTAIKTLDGTGHTKVTDLAKDGSHNTSSGDTLHVVFAPQAKPAKSDRTAGAKPAAKPAKKGNDSEVSQIETAIQDGHVIMTQTPAKKPGAKTDPDTLTAWANHAEYHAVDQILHLTGSPRLKDGDSMQLSAGLIDYHKDSGDATATGAVKAVYRQTQNQNTQQAQAKNPPVNPGPDLGGNGPVSITADHANLKHAENISYFYGTPSVPARMWQGDHAIAAPVLELSQNPQTLKAYGAPGSTGTPVSANLTSNLGAKHQPSVVRIHSKTLDYADAERRGVFKGSVVAEEPDGIIHSDQAEVFLTPKPAAKTGTQNGQPQTSVQTQNGETQNGQTQIDHIVATGNVVMTQPGRKAEGERLVYTAEDGQYVLTGNATKLPHVYDQLKGTTTGARLIFHSQDDSVVVSGGPSGAVTDTRAPK